MTPSDDLKSIHEGLREPLIVEYRSIITNFRERRWGPAEISAGKFCEYTYKILKGYPNNYSPSDQCPGIFRPNAKNWKTLFAALREGCAY